MSKNFIFTALREGKDRVYVCVTTRFNDVAVKQTRYMDDFEIENILKHLKDVRKNVYEDLARFRVYGSKLTNHETMAGDAIKTRIVTRLFLFSIDRDQERLNILLDNVKGYISLKCLNDEYFAETSEHIVSLNNRDVSPYNRACVFLSLVYFAQFMRKDMRELDDCLEKHKPLPKDVQRNIEIFCELIERIGKNVVGLTEGQIERLQNICLHYDADDGLSEMTLARRDSLINEVFGYKDNIWVKPLPPALRKIR